MFETLSLLILFKFLMVLIFGFLSGLELREYLYAKKDPIVLGTTRTFTFIALMGFVFNLVSKSIFMIGFVVIAFFYLIFYIRGHLNGEWLF